MLLFHKNNYVKNKTCILIFKELNLFTFFNWVDDGLTEKCLLTMGNPKNHLNLLDFGIIGEQLSITELLHSSCLRGKEDCRNGIDTDFKKKTTVCCTFLLSIEIYALRN